MRDEILWFVIFFMAIDSYRFTGLLLFLSAVLWSIKPLLSCILRVCVLSCAHLHLGVRRWLCWWTVAEERHHGRCWGLARIVIDVPRRLGPGGSIQSLRHPKWHNLALSVFE
ncbi:hypothetical protein B0T17DRAFT_542921 [Bombardia bombarda]|uniref:Uncharacterized protein n=1 Tax=Bombardia bombarda TaxID=252184 RepID=A0AA39U5Z2_9PEZI|nr:hypothetical protein B0T17DRAFT_542921 [Bombardia bombarda]